MARGRAAGAGPTPSRPRGRAAFSALGSLGSKSSPLAAIRRPASPGGTDTVVRLLLHRTGMNGSNLIAVRQVRIGNRLVTVELFRNEGRSVAARCVLGSGDTPIIDAPTAEEALAAVEDALEGLLLAREGVAA